MSKVATDGKQPEALKAIFPEVVAIDGYSSEIRSGGVFVQLYSNEDIQTLLEFNCISNVVNIIIMLIFSLFFSFFF